ncbi:MAG: hypothetical protein WCD76_07175 [Pyrinomonadaceae bacterium]
MHSHTDEEEIDLSELSRDERPCAAADSPAPFYFPAPTPLPAQLDRLVSSIEPLSLRSTVFPVFNELARLLDYLRIIESCFGEDKALQKTALIFKLLYEKTIALLAYVNERALPLTAHEERVRDVLDGMSFAIGHELRRVFRDEVPKLNSPQYSQLTRAELVRAYGLLYNCFQQSTVTLAQVFDPKLDGIQLFADHKVKVEQSLVLYGELFSLLQKVRSAERASGILSKHALVNHLRHFREETMHFLLYKDWVVFETFVIEIEKTYDGEGDFGPVLHKFNSYLQTLIKHVSMRDVLRNHGE